MVSIRFSRVGKKKLPTYKLIVVPKRKDPWGTYLENVGHYNPMTKEATLKEERIKYWLSVGAQPSETVHNFLITKGIIAGKKKNVSSLGKKFKAKLKSDAEAKKKAEAEKAKDTKAKAEAKSEEKTDSPAK
ncbi:MAG: 30S ribosomal protein S16 [Parcubacteria group bacterium]|nr:30S ribosomal protein S16 [Parcubacteria group bacterium]